MQGLRGISVFPHYNILTTPEFCTGLQDSALPDCGELEKTIIRVLLFSVMTVIVSLKS